MSLLSCRDYNSRRFQCRWLCPRGLIINIREKLNRKTEREQRERLRHEDLAESRRIRERLSREYRPSQPGPDAFGPRVPKQRIPGPDVFGHAIRGNPMTSGVSSASFEPTDSSAVDTGATRVEGGSNVNEKDFETRKAKAQELEVTAVGTDFLVKSSTRQGGYMVTVKEEGGYHCACMDFATHRGDPNWKCKHIIAVEDYLEKRGPANGDSRYDLLDLNE